MGSWRGRGAPAGGSAIASPDLLARFHSLRQLSELPVGDARQIYDQEASVMFGLVEEVGSVTDEVITERKVRVRIYRPGVATGRTLVYFHGGGWVVGSLDSHDGVTRFLSRFGGCEVVSVDYALAPESKFPAALEDAWAVTRWLSKQTDELTVGGDSAGGNLAAVVATRARSEKLALKLQLLVYPVLDCRPLFDEGGENRYWVRSYLRDLEDATDPEASPMCARDLGGLAPALLLSCGLDPLRTQAEEYCRRLGAAGVTAQNLMYPQLIHAAYRMPGVLPAARQMLVDSASALKLAFGA